MKALTDSQYAFKVAVARAVKMGGGCNAMADIVRADAPRLSRYGNIREPEFAPVDVCAEIDAEIVKRGGDPVVLRAYADLFGFDLAARAVEASVTADLIHCAGGVAKESGELISQAIAAAADGHISPREAIAIDNDAADLQAKIVHLRSVVRPALAG